MNLDPDRVWQAYRQLWALCEELCPVQYTDLINDTTNYTGAYFGEIDPRKRRILIRRSGSTGASWPVRNDLHVLVTEMTVLAHEWAHARHHVDEPGRFLDYLVSLDRWVRRDNEGGPFEDYDRGMIYEEESLAESDGRVIIKRILPEIIPLYDSRVVNSLTAYEAILWTGKYPDGQEHRWRNTKPRLEASQTKQMETMAAAEKIIQLLGWAVE
jgi:hypothetical protein